MSYKEQIIKCKSIVVRFELNRKQEVKVWKILNKLNSKGIRND